MRSIILVLSLVFLTGCATTKPTVLTETEAYYLLPANTPFRAIVKDGGKIEDVQRPYDSYVIDSGKLIKLQEQANSCTINK
jgi:uncharacterized lipoprotein YmbA